MDFYHYASATIHKLVMMSKPNRVPNYPGFSEARAMNLLPDFNVVCKIDDQIAAQIPILVRVAMRVKNDYIVVAGVTDSFGNLTVSGLELEKEIAISIAIFPMDYAEIEGADSAYAGLISVQAMTIPEVEKAIRAYDYFSKEVTYRKGYRSDLETAYRQLITMSPRRMDVEIGNVVDGTLTTRFSTASSAFPAMAGATHGHPVP